MKSVTVVYVIWLHCGGIVKPIGQPTTDLCKMIGVFFLYYKKRKSSIYYHKHTQNYEIYKPYF